MNKILFFMGIIFILSGCSVMKVDVDYDTSYNFDGKTKYAVVHASRAGENTLTNDRIMQAIKSSLNVRNYTNVQKNEADLIFVFHVNVKDKTDIRTDYQMVGYRGFGYGFGGGGMMIATPSSYSYTEGTLILDALNPKTKKIVWRGIASDELNRSETTPEEKREYINKVISELMKNFPKKKRG